MPACLPDATPVPLPSATQARRCQGHAEGVVPGAHRPPVPDRGAEGSDLHPDQPDAHTGQQLERGCGSNPAATLAKTDLQSRHPACTFLRRRVKCACTCTLTPLTFLGQVYQLAQALLEAGAGC